MIVGTAGHIDHGKTSLVLALTGVNVDRLPEEKKRGITIELGYAAMKVPGQNPIAFVDVPGHEKLVRTMIAGASGIDFALILIAADDGVMPQTQEHLSILSLLGLSQGAVVITKADKVDASLLAQRELEAQQIIASTSLAGSPICCVSSTTGEGIDALKQLLIEAQTHEAQQQAHPVQPVRKVNLQDAHFGARMDLDRVFTLDGLGTVVAGCLRQGAVKVGDSLCLAHEPTQAYRVRSLQCHNQSVQQVAAGQRCAIGLAGLERTQVERGQTLCDPRIALSTQRFEAWLTLLPEEDKALRSGTLVHLHVGTKEVMATVAVLGQASLEPGASALVQLVVQQPVHVWWGDQLVLRDASATRTLAGGQVLEPHGLMRYRQTPARLAYLRQQHEPLIQARFVAALQDMPFGLDATHWWRANGLVDWPFNPTDLPNVVADQHQRWFIAAPHFGPMRALVVDALTAFHTRWPDEVGPDVQRARRLALPKMPETLWTLLLEQLVRMGDVVLNRGFVQLPAHSEQLREADQIIADKTLPLLLNGAVDPPWVRDLAGTLRLPEVQVRMTLARLAKMGSTYKIVNDLYYHPQVVTEMASLIRKLVAQEGQVTAASFRDAVGLGRKRAIQILEFYDRIGFLRRVGDQHLLRPGTVLFPVAGS